MNGWVTIPFALFMLAASVGILAVAIYVLLHEGDDPC